MNTTIIQGRLVKDPEIRTTNTGKQVANFTIAEGDKNNTNYFECQAWEKRAEFLAQYFTKGKSILVVGRTITQKWEKDGKNYSKQIINVNEISFTLQDKEQIRTEAVNDSVNNDLPNIDEVELNDIMPF